MQSTLRCAQSSTVNNITQFTGILTKNNIATQKQQQRKSSSKKPRLGHLNILSSLPRLTRSSLTPHLHRPCIFLHCVLFLRAESIISADSYELYVPPSRCTHDRRNSLSMLLTLSRHHHHHHHHLALHHPPSLCPRAFSPRREPLALPG